jgi:protease I
MAKVLIVIPHDRFQDEEFSAIVNKIDNGNHQIQIGSSHHTEAKGHFGLLVKPDINLGFVEPSDYDVIVFIGGYGVEEYFLDTNVINLIRSFFTEKKLIAAAGLAVELLIYASIVAGRRIACIPELMNKVQGAGGYCTGVNIEKDQNILTGTGGRTQEAFADSLLEALDHLDPKRGLR